ncbi:hypothetical protein BGZ89_000079 [Linnemannia elongata]|nr:hypothetical protein BGZ89_000079 [Linnemannia elongata]
MTDTHPAPAATVEDVIPALEAATIEDKAVEHVHGPDCSHDHEHDHEHGEGEQAPQHRNDFDLLETNGTKDKTTDPLVKRYFAAKELFASALERLNQIPEGADAELIAKHQDEIVSVTKDLMKAFLLDEKACQMHQRILKLAEQYEVYVQTNNPEGTSTTTADSEEEDAEKQNTIYTKDSVVFVIMILWSGGQYEHCIQTIGFAIQEFADIKGRMLELRASCHMALRNFKACNEDLEEALATEPINVENHSTLGNVYYATHQAADALHHFKEFVKELYGVVTGFNEIKRTAYQAFQARTATRAGLIQTDPTPALLEASEALKKAFKNPGISACANCGRPDNVANEGRSQELKPKPLLKCAKCNKVAYCSRPCQITHWNATHKNTCKK